MRKRRMRRKSKYAAYERYIFSALRKIFGWTAEKTGLAGGKVGIDRYKCAKCGRIFSRKEIHVDHIIPVMPLTGWDGNWTEYIHRMFKGKTQVLCKRHHKLKTSAERKWRAEYERKKNEAKKT